jgi:hypothetical protein
MVRDVTNVWKKTADARWGDAKSVCVEGSFADKSSISGGASQQASTDKKKESAAPRVDGSGALMGLVVGLVGALWML